MIDLARYIPALMLASGAGVAAKGGGDVTKRIVDTVKVIATRYELGAIAQQIEISATSGMFSVPRDQKGFENFIHENMGSRSDRDTAEDMWGQKYKLVKINGKPTLLSSGPNLKRDQCHHESADDQIEAAVSEVDKLREAEKKQAEALKKRLEALQAGEDVAAPDDIKLEVEAPEAAREDDVCVTLLLEAKGKGGKGGVLGDVLGNQSPYRQIER